MDVSNLDIFIRVMQRRSLARVGRDLGISTSTVSRNLGSLEAELGVKLFERTTRKVSPTEAGRMYFERIEPVVRELKEATTEARNLVAMPSGVLRVACPVSFADSFLSGVLDDFFTLYPDLTIDLLASNTSYDLHAEQIDIAIRYGRLQDSSIVAFKLSPLKEILVASPNYLSHSPEIALPTDLTDHTTLSLLLAGYSKDWLFRSPNEKEISIPINPILRSSSAAMLKEASVNGLGVSLLPSIVADREVKEGKLIPILPEYACTATNFGSSIWILYPSREYLPLRARVFIDHLKKSFPN